LIRQHQISPPVACSLSNISYTICEARRILRVPLSDTIIPAVCGFCGADEIFELGMRIKGFRFQFGTDFYSTKRWMIDPFKDFRCAAVTGVILE